MDRFFLKDNAGSKGARAIKNGGRKGKRIVRPIEVVMRIFRKSIYRGKSKRHKPKCGCNIFIYFFIKFSFTEDNHIKWVGLSKENNVG